MKLKEETTQETTDEMRQEVKNELSQEFYDWNVHDLTMRIRDQMNLLQWIPLTLTEKTESELDQLSSIADFEIKYLKLTRENLILKLNGGARPVNPVTPRVVELQNDLREMSGSFVTFFERNWPESNVDTVFLGGSIGILGSMLFTYLLIGLYNCWSVRFPFYELIWVLVTIVILMRNVILDHVILPPYHYLTQFVPVKVESTSKESKAPTTISFLQLLLQRYPSQTVVVVVSFALATNIAYSMVSHDAKSLANYDPIQNTTGRFVISFFIYSSIVGTVFLAMLIPISLLLDGIVMSFLTYQTQHPKMFELWRIYHFIFIDHTVYKDA